MQDKYIQSVRDKLKKRVQRLKSPYFRSFPGELHQFFAFFDSQPLLCALRDKLLASIPTSTLDALIGQRAARPGEPVMGETEAEQAAFGYRVLKKCECWQRGFDPGSLAQQYGLTATAAEPALNEIRRMFLEPFYEYLDEHLDDQQAILYVLWKYKHRCEWFPKERNRLHGVATRDSKKAESSLAFDLYEYLHEHGIDFSVEPKTASGRPDLVIAGVGDDRIVADCKVFRPPPSKGKANMVSGFNQVYTYLSDYSVPFGYLVIFKICDHDLTFDVPHTNGIFQSLPHNNKTIFLVVVDICHPKATASKKGPLKPQRITADELIRSVLAVDAEPTAGDGPAGETKRGRG